MKRSIFIIMSLIALLLTACGSERGSGNLITEEREVSDFDRVELAGVGELTLTQGESESLTIEAEEHVMPKITSEVRNGTLVIGLDDAIGSVVISSSNTTVERGSIGIDSSYNRIRIGLGSDSIELTKPIKFNLTVRKLEGLLLSGPGSINSANLNSEDLDLTLSGSGDIEIANLAAEDVELHINGSGELAIDTLSAKKVEATLTGSGEVELAGQVNEQKITLSGSGEYRAAELESQEVEVELSGGGDVAVWANERLDVEMNGSGDVNYVGAPTLSEDISGSGSLTRLNQ